MSSYFITVNERIGLGKNLIEFLKSLSETTNDDGSASFTDIETHFGLLTVYGSIIGVFGSRQPRFDNDLSGHLSDFEKIFPGRQICFAGDLNITFSGQPWPSNKARQALVDTFKKYGLTNTTANMADTVDHIVLSNDFLDSKQLEIETWNTDKKLSDHVGHLLTLKQ